MDEGLLWQQLQEGHKDALEQLYRRHAAALLQYGGKFSGDTQLVEDCVQELFIELWRKRGQLGAVKSVRSYLLVSLRRKTIRAVQRNNRRETSAEPEEHQFEAELAIDEQIIADELSRERQRELKQAFGELSARQREAIYLRYQMDMDYDEICRVMDISYQSVRNLVSSAIKRLQKLMAAGWWLLIFQLFRFPLVQNLFFALLLKHTDYLLICSNCSFKVLDRTRTGSSDGAIDL